MSSPLAALRGKRILVTGHTGFKGGWLTLWLQSLGARVTGYALAPESEPSFYGAAAIATRCTSIIGDVRDRDKLARTVKEADPEVVLHLAAQSLVRRSYAEPHATLEVNVMGTANLLEAIRDAKCRAAVVVVTSDKCYENREWPYAYRENDPLGGHDVYSMSKAAAELVASSWRRSFFDPRKLAEHGVAIATARAGNVIGGGDWAENRIVPDAIRALAKSEAIVVRNPASVRPWQHVLEPLGGYLALAARLLGEDRERYCTSYNFGPAIDGACTVAELCDRIVAAWGSGQWIDKRDPNAPHEAGLLRLAIDRAAVELAWKPRWSVDEAIRHTVAWYRAFHHGGDVARVALEQIEAYSS
ncbi:MAG: CDP-glucose 4,6-dehydratase [Polyangiales bacterium]